MMTGFILKQASLAVAFYFITYSAAAQQLDSVLNKNLLAAKQGSIVQLPGFLTERFQQISYQKIVAPGPQYIISDDPEYIRVPEALAVKERVEPGAVRLYVYNVNGVREPQKIPRKITALLKNVGTQQLSLRMLRYSSQKPSTNYFLCGKNGLADYFASKPSTTVRIVRPGEVVPIDAQLEKNVVQYDELVHGIYEFLIDGPAEIAVLQTDLKSTGAQAWSRLKTAQNSRHTNAGRGLFGVSNYSVLGADTISTERGAVQLLLADGVTDPWIKGKDASTGQIATLAGNYGVMYNIELHWKSKAGKALALVTWNARAGDNKWCGGMANTMVTSGGKFSEGIIQLPADSLRTKGAPEAVLVQIFTPNSDNSVQTIKLKYSPPGASCLPTPLIFIPVDLL